LLDGIGLRPDHRRCTLLLLLRSPSTTILDPVCYRISLLLPVVVAAGTIAQTASAASAAAAAAAAAATVVRPASAVDAPSAATVVDMGVSPAIVAILRLVHPRLLHCGRNNKNNGLRARRTKRVCFRVTIWIFCGVKRAN
jgi:hypothetical protein